MKGLNETQPEEPDSNYGPAGDAAFEQLKEHAFARGWFKIFLPEILGGAGCSFPEALGVLETAARLQGSLGWMVNLGAGSSWFYPYMAEGTAFMCWGAERSVVAGSGEKGKLLGNVLSGFWPRCTAAPIAGHFTLNVENEKGEVRTCVVKSEELELDSNSWTCTGMKRSGTWGARVQDLSLSPDRIFCVGRRQWGCGHYLEILPFEHFAKCCMSASILGLYEGVLDAAERNGITYNNMYAETGLLIKNWRELLRNSGMGVEGGFKTFHERAFWSVQRLFLSGGLNWVSEGHELYERYADFMTACLHPYVELRK